MIHKQQTNVTNYLTMLDKWEKIANNDFNILSFSDRGCDNFTENIMQRIRQVGRKRMSSFLGIFIVWSITLMPRDEILWYLGKKLEKYV